MHSRGCYTWFGEYTSSFISKFDTLLSRSQNESLFGWLTNLYPIWNKILPSDIYISTLIGLSEMVISGCTTSSDHLYLFPNGSKLENQIEAAGEVVVGFMLLEAQ